ncbi:MAG: DUF559 domain-containing protein [Elusimicrobia bacterium]|nr:DUF559 domain-containing protein [Elusimicrobiota bacterium]
MKQYREDLKNRAQKLRKQSTDTEKFLWKHLRNKQITGIKFRRQQPVGKYIVDFISCEMKIIIEVDGGQHTINRAKDIKRDRYLNKEGYKVLRFWDNEVLTNIEGVIEVIMRHLSPSPLPSPLKGEGEKGREARKVIPQGRGGKKKRER